MIISLSMSLVPIFSVVFKTGGENRQNSVVIRVVTLYMSLFQLRARSIFKVLLFFPFLRLFVVISIAFCIVG